MVTGGGGEEGAYHGICSRVNLNQITVKIWDAATGMILLTLPVDRRCAGDVAFSSDGKRLAVGAVAGLNVFALPIEDFDELANSQLTRSLTDDECQRYLHVLFGPGSPESP